MNKLVIYIPYKINQKHIRSVFLKPKRRIKYYLSCVKNTAHWIAVLLILYSANTLADDIDHISELNNSLTQSQSTDFGYSAPVPHPKFPDEIGDYNPPSFEINNLNAPIISDYTKTARQDETVVVAGTNFSSEDNLTFKIFDQSGTTNGKLLSVKPGSVSEYLSSFIIPKDFSEWSMFMIWPMSKGVIGKPITVNKTEAWWVGPDMASSGELVSVYGRNLSFKNGSKSAWVFIRPVNESNKSGADGFWATITEVNPYRVTFKLPSGLQNGTFEIWAHNGHGGRYGWSKPLKLKISNNKNIDKANIPIINVKKYGAVGNGITDDTVAIKKALSEAKKSSPSTLYFPQGKYIVSDGLWLENSVSWKGDGKDLSMIETAPAFVPSEFALIQGSRNRGDNVHIEDITIRGTGKNTIRNLFHAREIDNLTLNNVNLSGNDQWKIDYHLSRHLNLNNFVLDGVSVFFGNASQVFINGCQIIAMDSNEQLTFWGGREIDISQCTVKANPMSKQHGGRFIVVQGHWGANDNFYIAQNETINFAPLPGREDQNSGEQILFEVAHNVVASKVFHATGNSVTIANKSTINKQPLKCVIVSGKGLGQIRNINDIVQRTYSAEIMINKGWDIIPDLTSEVIVTPAVQHIVIYNNEFDGLADYSKRRTASVAINLYGSAYDVIIANNTASELPGMVHAFSLLESTGLTTQYWNIISDNKITKVLNGISFLNSLFSTHPYLHNHAYSHIGTITRNNSIRYADKSAFYTNLEHKLLNAPIMDSLVFEGNDVQNTKKLLDEDHGKSKITVKLNSTTIRKNIIYNQ